MYGDFWATAVQRGRGHLNNRDYFFLELSAISINGQTIVHDPLATIFGTAIDKLQP